MKISNTLCGLASGLFLTAALTHSTSAITLPVSEDSSTATSVAAAKAAGKSTSLSVIGTNKAALVRFDVGSLAGSFAAERVAGAWLTLYVNAATKRGDLTLHRVTQNWSEDGLSGTNAPSFAPAVLFTLASNAVVTKQFIVIDVTDTVKGWLDNPDSDFGFAMAGSGTVKVLLGAKEGASLGYPATLEIQTTPDALLDVSSSNSGPGAEGLRLSGQDFTGNASSAEGISLTLGYSAASNRQLWIGDSANLAVNSTNTVVRIIPASDNGVSTASTIDAIATDGITQKPLALNPNDGYVGIGTFGPIATLHINHTANATTAIDTAFLLAKRAGGFVLASRTFSAGGPFNLELFEGDAFKPGGGAWGAVSDRRLKKNIDPLNGALDRLLKLRSVTFEYKEPAKVHQFAGTQTGFIAQEVEEVFPEWVAKNAEGYKTVTIRGFESMSVQALRELRQEKDAEIASLKQELDSLKKTMAGQQQVSAQWEARFSALEKLMVKSQRKTADTAAKSGLTSSE